jgi:hypothetical protein
MVQDMLSCWTIPLAYIVQDAATTGSLDGWMGVLLLDYRVLPFNFRLNLTETTQYHCQSPYIDTCLRLSDNS